MKVKKLTKAVSLAFGGSALLLAATQANAISLAGPAMHFPTTSTVNTASGTMATTSWSNSIGNAKYGWAHTTHWYMLHVHNTSGLTIDLNAGTANNGAQANPAFSLFRVGDPGQPFSPAAASSHTFNQVAVTPTNQSGFLFNGTNSGAGTGNVSFVAYTNSGPTYTGGVNADGDTVLANSGGFGTGYSGNISTGTGSLSTHINAISAGFYLLDVGGSDPLTSPSPGASYNLTVSATSPVPLPPALWLFGSALMGMLGLGRRNKVSA